jgi:N-acetyl-anhydromuramyl-L-alanine amidase AmpD
VVQNFFVNLKVGFMFDLISTFFQSLCSKVGAFLKDSDPGEKRQPSDQSLFKKENISFPREFYDYADAMRFPMDRYHRKYTGNIPDGITIHYTASSSVDATIKALRDRDLNYHLIIDRNGKVHQTSSFFFGTWHAGKAIWRGQSPNYKHLSVALVSWGWITRYGSKYEAWTGHLIPDDEVRCKPVNGTEYWHKATDPQQASLMRFLRWAVDCGMDPDKICGHDECAMPAGRKLDPGGVLAWPVSGIRDKLRGRASGLV